MSDLIHAYTRAQALEDGEQVEVSTVAREAGIQYPVFLTRNVFDEFVAVPPDGIGQDEAGRLWDVIWMLRHAMKTSDRHSNRVNVSLHVHNDRRPTQRHLVAVCGPMDIDDCLPVITVMLPDEE